MAISLFDIGINVLESTVSVFFLVRYFRMKPSFTFMYLVLWIFYLTIGISCMNAFLGYEKYFMLFIPIWAYLPWLVVFGEGSIIEKGYISMFVVQLHALITTLIVMGLSLFVYRKVDAAHVISVNYTFIAIASKLIFLGSSLIIARERRKLKTSLQFNALISFAAFSIIALLIYISLEDILYVEEPNLIDVMIALIGLLLLVISVFIIFFRIQVANEKNLENKLRLQSLNYQEHLNEVALEANRETNKVRHNLKHVLSHIEFLIAHNRSDEALKSIQKNLEVVRTTSDIVLTPNEVINYILNIKNSVALEKGIAMRFLMNFLNTPQINDMDLSILLGNAIDNAIENCIGKSIEVRIEDKNEYLHITVSNGIHTSVLELNENLETTKKKKGHGYGIKSMKEIAKRNDGEVDFYEKNDRFFCSILIK